MVNNFEPLVDFFNKSLVEEYREYYGKIDDIYDLLENKVYHDKHIETIERIKYHVANILFLKRLIGDDINLISTILDSPEDYSNFQIQKAIRSFFMDTATLVEALNLVTNSHKQKHIENLTINLESPLSKNFKNIRNHVTHEGILGIDKRKRPGEIAHADIVTPPKDTLSFYFISDNDEKFDFAIDDLRTGIYFPFKKYVERFLDEILIYCMKLDPRDPITCSKKKSNF
jgi:hypothetical protein